LLWAGGELEKVIISPLPRYIIPCCGDSGHITNRGEDDFKQKMCADLGEFKKSLKDLIFGKKIRNFKVLDPLDLMYGGYGDSDERPKKGFWKNDPVHPTSAGYENLVNGIIKQEISFNRSYTAGGNKQQVAKHIKRQRWVEQDDATAHRVYKNDFQQAEAAAAVAISAAEGTAAADSSVAATGLASTAMLSSSADSNRIS
jgi:hypothetical protein